MAGVSVTIGSLNTAKKAFSDFQVEVESFSDKISSIAEQVVVAVKQAIKKQEAKVIALENKVAALINELERIQASIISVNTNIASLKERIESLERQIPQLEKQISQLEQQRRQLEAQKNNADDESRRRIEEQIRAIDNQIQNCRRKLQQIKEQLSSAKAQLAACEKKLAELKNLKIKTENELSLTRNELNRAKSKLERLSAAGDSVELEIGNLNTAARKFEQMSSTTNASSQVGINKCIAEIEEYLAVNFGVSGQGNIGHESSGQTDNFHIQRNYPYESSDEMRDEVYYSIRGYQENPGWNQIIRSGGTTPEIDNFRSIIHQNSLSTDTHFIRRASLADMGQDLQNLSLEDLGGRSYSFVGIMSVSGTQELADNVSSGNVIYDITARSGTTALDLTNLPDFQEAMFDSPTCYIESAEMCGYNTIRIHITI